MLWQFTRSVEPYHHGYIVFSSYKTGGKFVTAAERDALVADFRRNFRPAALLGLVLLVVLFAAGWTALSISLDFPAHTGWIGSTIQGLVFTSWMLWIFSAPSRLVRGRPDVTPPRSKAEWRQYQLKITAWWQITVILLGGIGALYVASTLPKGSITRLFLIGSGCFALGLNGVQAVRKWRYQSA